VRVATPLLYLLTTRLRTGTTAAELARRAENLRDHRDLRSRPNAPSAPPVAISPWLTVVPNGNPNSNGTPLIPNPTPADTDGDQDMPELCVPSLLPKPTRRLSNDFDCRLLMSAADDADGGEVGPARERLYARARARVAARHAIETVHQAAGAESGCEVSPIDRLSACTNPSV
jgi:hypothetical protein